MSPTFQFGSDDRARRILHHPLGSRANQHAGYHRAEDAALRGRFMIYKRDDQACWLDELEPRMLLTAS
jgi:hypothetical protein